MKPLQDTCWKISLYKNAENRGKCKLWNHCKIPEIIISESPSYFRLFLMPGWITFSTNLSIVPFICPGNTIIIFIIINPHNNTLLKKTPRWAMGIHGISWKSRFPFLICIFHEPIVEMAWWSTLERFSRVEKAFLKITTPQKYSNTFWIDIFLFAVLFRGT